MEPFKKENDMSRTRVALVSGASRGIGLETARQLGQIGVEVVMTARSEVKAIQAANTLLLEGLKAVPLKLDVVSEEDWIFVRDFLDERYGKLDILINNAAVWLESENAGQRVPNRTSSISLELLHNIFDVNFFSIVGLTQTLLPLLHESPAARIVNVSSNMGSLSLQADPAYPHYSHKIFGYSSSKTALNSFTIHLAHELQNTRIKVNSVHPGWVRTGMGGAEADLDVRDGARSVVAYAVLAEDGPTGGFFEGGKVVPW